MDLRLVVERESPAFPAVIHCDILSVDGFDNTVKCLTLFFLRGNFARCKTQAGSNDDEYKVGFHGIVLS